ncbi:MAG: hypothetical protein IT223_03755 [Crocinitomicaceae bacterium]|nr:hypothetical protein [Crocinitomicaceae bacterium]
MAGWQYASQASGLSPASQNMTNNHEWIGNNPEGGAHYGAYGDNDTLNPLVGNGGCQGTGSNYSYSTVTGPKNYRCCFDRSLIGASKNNT